MRARQWRRLAAMLAFLGPGIITGAAGDDAGGIATYASIGAQYGYSLLWVMGPITLALIVVQVQVARMGVVTGKGFAELIREQFGVRWTAFAMLILLVANGTVTVAEFAGIAAATDIFNERLVGPAVIVPAATAALRRVEKFRLFYDVLVEGARHIVKIKVVAHKEHNKLFIGGQEVQL